jgi:hypothetical protein
MEKRESFSLKNGFSSLEGLFLVQNFQINQTTFDLWPFYKSSIRIHYKFMQFILQPF